MYTRAGTVSRILITPSVAGRKVGTASRTPARVPRARRYRRAQAGLSVVELLVGSLLSLLTGAALVMLQLTSYNSSSAVLGQNFANANARQPLDILADTLRNAQAGGSANEALAVAGTSDVTCYTSPNTIPLSVNPNSTARIYLNTNTGTIERIKTDSSGTSTTELLINNVSSLQMTYYVPAGGAYTATTPNGWSQSADPTTDVANIGAVDIKATVTINGSTRALESFVRLRNSPYIQP